MSMERNVQKKQHVSGNILVLITETDVICAIIRRLEQTNAQVPVTGTLQKNQQFSKGQKWKHPQYLQQQPCVWRCFGQVDASGCSSLCHCSHVEHLT